MFFAKKFSKNPPASDPPADVGDVLLNEFQAVEARRRVLAEDVNEAKVDRSQPSSKPYTEKLADYYHRVHTLGDLSALCLSGGGIRSAAFALGVIQGLAARGLLVKFDYLSTVSGGGYLGSFLTAWVHRQGYDVVSEKLSGRADVGSVSGSPLQHLRRYSNYLTPRTGLISADTLMLAALYVRNLLLNWLILLPAALIAILVVKIIAVGIWALVAWNMLPSTESSEPQEYIEVPPSVIIALLGIAAISLIGFALLDSLRQRPGWEYEASSSSKFHRQELFPMLFGGAVMSWTALAWLTSQGQEATLVGVAKLASFGMFGSIIFSIDWLIAYVFSKPRGPESGSTENNIHTSKLRYRLGSWLSYALAGCSAGVLLGALISWAGLIENVDMRALVLSCFGPTLLLTALFAGELIHVGLTSYSPWGDAEREWLARAAGYHGRASLAWATISLLILGGPWAVWSLYQHHDWLLSFLTSIGGLSGIATALLGRASTTAAVARERHDSWKNASAAAILKVTMPIFIVFAVVLLSTGVDLLAKGQPILFSSVVHSESSLWLNLVIMLAIMVFIGSIASIFININRFSLHGVYRNRLIRTFLGASNVSRRPNGFTDFDERDNVKLADLWPNTGTGCKIPPQLLVTNCALNIVATRELALQERKALPFTAGPLWIGSAALTERGSYRSSEKYGDGMTLGTAITISGAAASPNMGYHSSTALGVLLTLFNVRLGAWLGNPSEAGSKTYVDSGPAVAAKPLIQEALGVTTDNKDYVYLSDGGHFENLGLFEMVRRRCHLIVAVDAGCDPQFAYEDLGNAVRKISIDLNVPIDFKLLKMVARHSSSPPNGGGTGSYCALASIQYREAGAKPGLLLYIKPGYYGEEPAPVRSYASLNLAFPHESTSDQWFGESQFEAYRALGEYVMRTIAGNQPCSDIKSFISAVEEHQRVASA